MRGQKTIVKNTAKKQKTRHLGRAFRLVCFGED